MSLTSFARALCAGLALALGAATASAQVAWQTIPDPGPVLGADGKLHQASCSAFPGTDPSWRFWVRPGDPKKLAVVFDGGGACWDDLTCSHPYGVGAMGGARPAPGALLQFYTPAIPPDADPSRYGGLLDLDDPANPVRDWTGVAVPYCTGDVHLGSADRVYDGVGQPQLPSSFTLRHRGQDNFMVVLDWIAKNLPQDVEDLLVTGASAGGYGAAGHFPWLAQQFPQARLSVLADASQGVTTPAFDAGDPGRGAWNPQLAPWVFGSDPLAVRSHELMRRGAAAYPQGRFAQYTTTADGVQVGFYAVMRIRHGPGEGDCSRLTPDWNRQMLATLAQDKALLPNFRAYVQRGTGHTILGDDDFYVAPPRAPSMAAWLRTMLDPAAGPAWGHGQCPGCLRPMRCR